VKPEQSNPDGVEPAQMYGIPRYRVEISAAVSPIVGGEGVGSVTPTPDAKAGDAENSRITQLRVSDRFTRLTP
jgi:hypothetical protein